MGSEIFFFPIFFLSVNVRPSTGAILEQSMRLVDSASCLSAARVALLALVQIQYHNHTVCQVEWGKVFSEPEFWGVFCIRGNTILWHGGHRMRELGQQNAKILEQSMRLVKSANCLLTARVALLALVQIQYHSQI